MNVQCVLACKPFSTLSTWKTFQLFLVFRGGNWFFRKLISTFEYLVIHNGLPFFFLLACVVFHLLSSFVQLPLICCLFRSVLVEALVFLMNLLNVSFQITRETGLVRTKCACMCDPIMRCANVSFKFYFCVCAVGLQKSLLISPSMGGKHDSTIFPLVAVFTSPAI